MVTDWGDHWAVYTNIKSLSHTPATNILLYVDLKNHLGLSWWLSGKESAGRCRTHRSDLLPGKIPHALEQLSAYSRAGGPQLLSPRAATTEARVRRACAPSKGATAGRGLRTTPGGKPAQQPRPAQPKINFRKSAVFLERNTLCQ